MIKQLQRLLFAVARAAPAQRRANSAETATAEHEPVDVALRQHCDARMPRCSIAGTVGCARTASTSACHPLWMCRAPVENHPLTMEAYSTLTLDRVIVPSRLRRIPAATHGESGHG